MNIFGMSHNQEDSFRPVQNDFPVDMTENSSKTGQKSGDAKKLEKEFRARPKQTLRLESYSLPRPANDLEVLSHAGAIQISVKCLCWRSWL